MTQAIPLLKACLHCGLEVPKTRDSGFCCAGCECVYKTISSLGLDNFYDIKRRLEIDQLIAPKEYKESFSYLDDECFCKDYVIHHDNGLSSIKLHLDGLHCAACVWLLEHLANKIQGVESIRVNFPRSEMLLHYSPSKISLSRIAQTISQLGYYPRPTGQESKKAERKQMLIRLGIAAICAGNTMMLAVSIYQGWFSGIEQRYVDLFNYLSLILAIPSVFYCARPFYIAAWQGLKVGFAHMDLPISIGIILGFVASCWNTFQANEHVYFDTLCMLIFLLLFGRWLQKNGVEKAEQYADSCESLLPFTAVKIENEIEQNVYSYSIKPGDIVRVRSGQRLAVDGQVISGKASLDLSVITGESLPRTFSVGDRVEAGTLVSSGTIDVKVLQSGSSTRIGQLLDKTENELLNKPNLVRTTDKIAGYFVIAVLLITFLCASYWILNGEYQKAFENCLAILIISCPCALGMSAPIAVSIALKAAARLGITIKNSDLFERLAVINRACLDKTGTLTIGRPTVEEAHFYGSRKSSLLDLCYSAELNWEHPIASALRLYCLECGAKLIPVYEINEITGSGLEVVTENGIFFIGSLKWIKEKNIILSLEQSDFCKLAVARSLSPVMLTDEKNVLAIFAIGDSIKLDARDFIASLSAQGIVSEIVSGDSKEIVQSVASRVGIEKANAYGEMSPEDKLEHISNSNLKTLMLGDGINDSAALASASVGIAVFGGAEQSLKFADAYTNSSKLMPISSLIGLSKSTLSTIKRNIAFSICYNILGVGLAFVGFINPLFAAILMPISSLSVIGSSLMILKEKK